MNDMENNMPKQSQEEMIKELRKELKFTRCCSLIVAVLLALVIAGGVYAVNKMTPALEAVSEMQPAIEKLEQLDIEMLNQKIEQLDIEGVNKIIEDLDASELSETLKNINDAAEQLREVREGFSEFTNSISDSFSGWFGKGTSNDGV